MEGAVNLCNNLVLSNITWMQITYSRWPIKRDQCYTIFLVFCVWSNVCIWKMKSSNVNFCVHYVIPFNCISLTLYINVAYLGHVDIVRKLLQQDNTLLNNKDELLHPMLIAARENHVPLIDIYRQYVDINTLFKVCNCIWYGTMYVWYSTMYVWYGTMYVWYGTMYVWYGTMYVWYGTMYVWYGTMYVWYGTMYVWCGVDCGDCIRRNQTND